MFFKRTVAVVLVGVPLLASQALPANSAAICGGQSGQFLKVSPTGSYLKPVHASDVVAAPSRLNLRQYRIRRDDYMGLRAIGAFDAGQGFDDDIQSLTAVFYNRKSFLAPGDFGQQLPIVTFAKDIPEDFMVVAGTTTIVRVPRAAHSLAFGPDDEYFSDNTDPNGDYGVCITLPNSSPGRSGNQSVLAEGLELEEDEAPAAMNERFLANLASIRVRPPSPAQVAHNAAFSNKGRLGAGSIPPVKNPQYRGWYDNCDGVKGKACWRPSTSRFKRKTGGVSIFAPKGTPIVAPLNGGTLSYNPAGFDYSTWGNVAVVSFEKAGVTYHTVYAHLDRFAGYAGVPTKAGEPIGFAGCTGSAGNNTRCAEPLNGQGAQTDHVYVALIRQVKRGKRVQSKAVNPMAYLGWKIRQPR